MISLSGIELSDDLQLKGLEDSPGIAYTQKRTILGNLVIHTSTNIGGRSLSLQGTNDYTQEQIDQIKELEQAGSVVELIHPRGTFNVLITNVAVTQATENPEPSSEEWYSGEISMIEV